MSAAASASQTPRMETAKLETVTQSQTVEEAGPTGEEATLPPTVEQMQPAIQAEQTAPVAIIKSNGHAVRENNNRRVNGKLDNDQNKFGFVWNNMV